MIEINAEEKPKVSLKEVVKNINKCITGDVLANLAYSSMIMIYFMFFNIQYEAVSEAVLVKYINISSLVFLGLAIFIIEIAYKKESDNILIYGLEFLVLSIFTLLIFKLFISLFISSFNFSLSIVIPSFPLIMINLLSSI